MQLSHWQFILHVSLILSGPHTRIVVAFFILISSSSSKLSSSQARVKLVEYLILFCCYIIYLLPNFRSLSLSIIIRSKSNICYLDHVGFLCMLYLSLILRASNCQSSSYARVTFFILLTCFSLTLVILYCSSWLSLYDMSFCCIIISSTLYYFVCTRGGGGPTLGRVVARWPSSLT